MLTSHFAVTIESTILTAEPVTTSDLKAHIRVTGTGEDTLLGSYLTAARIHTENMTHRSLVMKQLRLDLDRFPRGRQTIDLPRPPLQSVDVITYTDDPDGSSTVITTSNMVVDIRSEPGRVGLVDGESWPSVRSVISAVTVQYTAGYDPDTVPAPLLQAIRMLAGHWFIHRESTSEKPPREIDSAFQSLVGTYRFGDYY